MKRDWFKLIICFAVRTEKIMTADLLSNFLLLFDQNINYWLCPQTKVKISYKWQSMLTESAALVCHFILCCLLGDIQALCYRQSISMTRKAARINPNGNLFPPYLSTGSSHLYALCELQFVVTRENGSTGDWRLLVWPYSVSWRRYRVWRMDNVSFPTSSCQGCRWRSTVDGQCHIGGIDPHHRNDRMDLFK